MRPTIVVDTMSSSEFARTSRGICSAPSRFRKNVSAAFLTTTSASPVNASTSAPHANSARSPRSMPSLCNKLIDRVPGSNLLLQHG